jgi:hypothetical protein
MKRIRTLLSACTQWICLAAGIILSLGFLSAKAEDWEGSVFVAGRWNPLGLSLEADLGPKWQIYSAESEVLRLNFLRPFFFLGISPTRFHTGVGFDLQPLSIFGLKTHVGQVGYFGTYGNLQSFESSNVDWGDSTRKEDSTTQNSSLKNSQKLIGDWYVMQAYMQAKMSDFGLKLGYGLQLYSFDLPQKHVAFYDPNDDVLLENKKWSSFVTLAVACDTLKESTGIKLGVSARSHQVPFSDGRHIWTLKWGPFAAYDWAISQTAFFALQWSPHHEIRKHSGPKGVPAVVLGHNTDFSF